MAEGKVPKPAPKSRYGPSFDEIERRDPVQWSMGMNHLNFMFA